MLKAMAEVTMAQMKSLPGHLIVVMMMNKGVLALKLLNNHH